MCAFQLLVAVDPSLGRVDYSLMSDQTLMEMLVEGFDDRTQKTYQDDNGMYLDVCQWWCIKCDADESVIQIRIDSTKASGLLALCYVPPKVKALDIRSWGSSKITGSVELSRLPDGMESLYLDYNQLTGSVDLTKVPWKMQMLLLTNNKLTGEIDLTQLPDRTGVLKNFWPRPPKSLEEGPRPPYPPPPLWFS